MLFSAELAKQVFDEEREQEVGLQRLIDRVQECARQVHALAIRRELACYLVVGYYDTMASGQPGKLTKVALKMRLDLHENMQAHLRKRRFNYLRGEPQLTQPLEVDRHDGWLLVTPEQLTCLLDEPSGRRPEIRLEELFEIAVAAKQRSGELAKSRILAMQLSVRVLFGDPGAHVMTMTELGVALGIGTENLRKYFRDYLDTLPESEREWLSERYRRMVVHRPRR